MIRSLLVPALAAALAAASTPAHAESYVSIGYGGTNCIVWSNARLGRPIEAQQLSAWIFGFISAYNAYVSRNPNVVGTTDIEGVRHWIDDYCRTNPQENLGTAVQFIIERQAGKTD